jgi:hypothetical protein
MAELEAREAAAQARAEALRARIAELTEQLTVEEELCSRLGVTRQTVLEILGGGDDSGWGAVEGVDGRPGGVEQDGDGAVRAALRLDGPVARAALEAALRLRGWVSGRPARQCGGAALEAQAPGAARLAGRARGGSVCPPPRRSGRVPYSVIASSVWTHRSWPAVVVALQRQRRRLFGLQLERADATLRRRHDRSVCRLPERV